MDAHETRIGDSRQRSQRRQRRYLGLVCYRRLVMKTDAPAGELSDRSVPTVKPHRS
jgi:hypothetical protein